MICVFCKTGQTTNGETTLTLQRGNTIVVVTNIPAKVCDNCGEAFLDTATQQQVLSLAEENVGSEITLVRFTDLIPQ